MNLPSSLTLVMRSNVASQFPFRLQDQRIPRIVARVNALRDDSRPGPKIYNSPVKE